MSDRSTIEWTDATWNPVRARFWQLAPDGFSMKERIGHHCEHVSEGCRNCYAERFNLWRGTGWPYKPSALSPPDGEVEVFLDGRARLAPLRWRRPRRIFVGSMTDLFADFVTDAMLDCIFAVMAACSWHTFQVLTKRPARMRAYLGDAATRVRASAGWPLPNVWLGTSCEDQATADARVPELLATPAAVHFVSAEPLLGPLSFRWPSWLDYRGRTASGQATDEYDGLRLLDWIIVGGESGPGARPMHPAWARSIRDQCAAAGVAFHFKQRGAWSWLEADGGEWPVDADGCIRMREDGTRGADGWPFQRVGKRHAGRLLDGVTHDSMPEKTHA